MDPDSLLDCKETIDPFLYYLKPVHGQSGTTDLTAVEWKHRLSQDRQVWAEKSAKGHVKQTVKYSSLHIPQRTLHVL